MATSKPGCIRQRSKGSWEIIWELPRGADGKRQSRSETFRGTKKGAQDRLGDILEKVKQKNFIDPRTVRKMTVAAFLDRWLDSKRSDNKAASTIRGYESYIERHLKPALGHLLLHDLHSLAVEEFKGKMLNAGRHDQKSGGLSPRTALHAYRILHSALEWAVKHGLRTSNPCDAVDAPSAPSEELQSLTEDQVVSLLAALKNTPLHIAALLAVATGCRRGELCGLRWDDVNLDRGQVIVRRATDVGKGSVVTYKQPKTHRSRRAVPIPAFAVDALHRHKGQQAQQRLLLGLAYDDGGHVIAWEDGRPLHPDYITKAFAKVARKLELPTTRFHALRHTCASVLLKADVHPRIVSEMLGHEDVRLTLRTYSHLLPGLAEEAARKLDDAIRRAGGV